MTYSLAAASSGGGACYDISGNSAFAISGVNVNIGGTQINDKTLIKHLA